MADQDQHKLYERSRLCAKQHIEQTVAVYDTRAAYKPFMEAGRGLQAIQTRWNGNGPAMTNSERKRKYNERQEARKEKIKSLGVEAVQEEDRRREEEKAAAQRVRNQTLSARRCRADFVRSYLKWEAGGKKGRRPRSKHGAASPTPEERLGREDKENVFDNAAGPSERSS